MPNVIAERYALVREVGRGGMGAVWLGHDQLLQRPVALKEVGLLPGSDRADVERVRREARVSAMLNHPNVVGIFDLVADNGRHWLVMEYVDGETLADRVRQQGQLSPDEIAPILAQTAQALAAAHEAGIVHRDVKPSNILLGRDGTVKLGDFGIARTAADPTLTQTGMVTGSPGYMAPEVAAGKNATPASDVWSLGATIFHALSGRPPYDTGENLMGALYRLVHEEPPRTDRAGWLNQALLATMHRDPDGRWTAQQVGAFLEQGPSAVGSAPPVPEAAPVPPAPAAPGSPGSPLPAGSPVPAGSPMPAGSAPAGSPGPPGSPVPAGSAPAGQPGLDHPTLVQQTGPVPGARAGGPATYSGEAQLEETQLFAAPRRRSWMLAGAACVLLGGLLLAVLLLDGDPDDSTPPRAAGGSPSTTVTSTPKARPTAAGMEAFVRDYLDTVARDPALAWSQLTSEFQDQSGSYQDYIDWWGGLKKATVKSIDANPDDLRVTYEVRYDWENDEEKGKLKQDQPTLELAFDGSGYLIAGEE